MAAVTTCAVTVSCRGVICMLLVVLSSSITMYVQSVPKE